MDEWRKMVKKISEAPIEERPEIIKAVIEGLDTDEKRNAALAELNEIFNNIDKLKDRGMN